MASNIYDIVYMNIDINPDSGDKQPDLHDHQDLQRWHDEGGANFDVCSYDGCRLPNQPEPEKELPQELDEQELAQPQQTAQEPTPRDPQNFTEFWPTYLEAHSKPATRLVHFMGPPAGAAWVAGCVATGNPLLALAAPLVIYGPLFASHWLIEGNQPKSFGHPLWSVMGELKLMYLGLTGGLGKELEHLNIKPASEEWAANRMIKRLLGRSEQQQPPKDG